MALVAGPVSISEARKLPGLRLVVLQGFPSPWSQAAKAIFRVKRLPHTLVHRLPSDPEGALEDWTGQASFPAAMFESERPRTGWAEILLLAERLMPEPALVPSGSEERGLFFGLCHELCGEMGLGWCRRLEMVHAGWGAGDRLALWLGKKYGYTPELAAQAPGRVREILQLLADRKAKSPFLMGERLTALDLYFATFLNLVSPLAPELLKLPAALEKTARSADAEVHRILAGGLLAHRDRIYQEHLELPVAL
jgi:glutathione S-transferase